jgi:hypothetical protein
LPRKRKDNRIVFGSLTRERDMSILDDAIREHLELKRAHGADDAELKKLEDEAFGPPARPEEPDPFAEAPAEFLAAAEGEAGEQADAEPRAKRSAGIADLQEAPDQAPPPSEPEAEIDGGHSTEERHAIADQPTEHFDVEGEFEDAATEADAPSDDELLDAGLAEPRLAPVDPLAGIDADTTAEPEAPAEPAPAAGEEPEDEFEEFFSEQRLSDELNQALEAPLPDEPGAPITDESTAIYEVEEAEDEEPEAEDEPVEDVSDELPLPDETSAEHRLPDEATDEHELPEEISDEHETAEPEQHHEHEEDDEDGDEEPDPPAAPSHEDVLEDTPDFLEDAPEDDNLWFEQKPPKDFDFDD